jgi:hypothetical protein
MRQVNALIPAEKDEAGNFLMKFDPASQKAAWAAGPESKLYRLSPMDIQGLNHDSDNVQEFTVSPVAESNFSGIKKQLMQVSEQELMYN